MSMYIQITRKLYLRAYFLHYIPMKVLGKLNVLQVAVAPAFQRVRNMYFIGVLFAVRIY